MKKLIATAVFVLLLAVPHSARAQNQPQPTCAECVEQAFTCFSNAHTTIEFLVCDAIASICVGICTRNENEDEDWSAAAGLNPLPYVYTRTTNREVEAFLPVIAGGQPRRMNSCVRPSAGLVLKRELLLNF